ncbi:V-type ATP synthase subunit I [Aerococcus urinaeequi]|uniref:V-type ATP synthase subunit I n=1 Tax=Aerococcus viridans TaxID=1377 RepID=A0A2N6UCN4_9LACT|nr:MULTISPECIES: V-type ATP synthase subunit I [Aerococcus]OFU52550.1 V-type sodium ATPase, subunit I [Aerococcus sp. HMSC10H05]PMC79354.1 V-type ATP synthase subunit I [Aerococcus viridans]
MAIAKMQKVSIVTAPNNKEQLLYTLQTMQNIQVSDLSLKVTGQDFTFNNNYQNDRDYQVIYERGREVLNYLSQYQQKVSLKDKITAKRPQMTMDELHRSVDEAKALELIEQVEGLKQKRNDIQDQRQRVEDEQTTIAKWRALDVEPKTLKELNLFDVRLGTIPNDENRYHWQQLKALENVAVEEVFANENEIGVAIVALPGHNDNLQASLLENYFSEVEFNYEQTPEETFQSLEKERKQLIKDEEAVVKDLKDMQGSKATIQLAVEEFFNRSQRANAAQLSYDNQQLSLFSGWVEESQVENLQAVLEENFDADALALILEETTEQEVKEDEVPIKLHNASIVEPFEMITEMYSLPNYREKDPTNWVAGFYMLFFAMMMGDFGYGLLLWIGTLFALKVMDLRKGTKRFVKFGHILSYPTMLIGLAYGSIFGESLPFNLINPTDDALVLMVISLAIGYIHIFVGLCLNIRLQLSRKDYAAAYNDGVGWLALLIALAIGIAGFVFSIGSLITVAKWLAIVAAAGIILVPMFTSNNKAVGGVVGLYNLYGVSSYVGDFVSYTRLMALGISGGAIAMSFNILFTILPVPVRFTAGILMIIALQLFNMFLSLLSAYVHSMRLVFVEFFGKFYEGGGQAFKPIRTLQEFVSLKDVEEN